MEASDYKHRNKAVSTCNQLDFFKVISWNIIALSHLNVGGIRLISVMGFLVSCFLFYLGIFIVMCYIPVTIYSHILWLPYKFHLSFISLHSLVYLSLCLSLSLSVHKAGFWFINLHFSHAFESLFVYIIAKCQQCKHKVNVYCNDVWRKPCDWTRGAWLKVHYLCYLCFTLGPFGPAFCLC